MKILCISDEINNLIYSPAIKSRFKDIDIVLSCGDLRSNYYDYIMTNLNKPLLFVFGNHHLQKIGVYKSSADIYNLPQTPYNLRGKIGGTYIGGKLKKVKGLIIGGLGGSMKYNRGKNQYSNAQMFRIIVRMIPKLIFNRIFFGRFIDILVTHAPPFGIHDLPDKCHTGFKAFLWFMRKFKPQFLVHGHIHLYDQHSVRESRYHDTTVINAFSCFIIEIIK